LAKHAARHHKVVGQIVPAALELLAAHDWPGNVRELENALERAVILTKDDITVDALPPSLRTSSVPPRSTGSIDLPLVEARTRFELRYLNDMLEAAAGNLSSAAKRAGMDRSNFRRLLRRHGVASAANADPDALAADAGQGWGEDDAG
jgi:two-component system response regulator HydG